MKSCLRIWSLPLVSSFNDLFARGFLVLAGSLIVSTVAFGDRIITNIVRIERPTIIGFLPPELKTARDAEATSAVSHLQFALRDTLNCLKSKKISAKLLYADRVVIKSGGDSEEFLVKDLGQAIGAIIVEPNRMAVVVFSDVGPSSLQSLLPHAAAEYWNVGSCAQRHKR